MKLTPSQAQLIEKARRSQKIQRIIAWGIVLFWPAWTYLAAQGSVPRLELPLATVLLFAAVPYLVRPVVDARVLDVVASVVSDNDETLRRNT
jgi:hypothetical protein